MFIKEILFYISSVKYLNIPGKCGYFLLSKLLSFIFWMSPEIRSLYLAGSMASGDIIPGLSDIDFVVVIKDLQSEDEYRFINNLEAKLKYLMPPFGKNKIGHHVAIYSVSEWELLGDIFLGKRYGLPKMVFEKDKVKFKNRFDNFTKALHHFYKALWRLETIQQNLSNPAKKKFDIMLRVRMMERSFLSVINGANEILGDDRKSRDYEKLINEIREELKEAGMYENDSYTRYILPKLIHFFDLSISNSLSLPDKTRESNSFRQIDGVNGYNESQAKELADAVSGLLNEEPNNRAIYVSRIHSNDYFLYDPSNYELCRKLINHYMNNDWHTLRILSECLFERLYLNYPLGPFVFIRLTDIRPFLAEGSYSHERFILEAYSTFPQLRAAANVSDIKKYNSYREKILQLIDYCGSDKYTNSEKEIRGSDQDYEKRDAEERNNEYKRFKNLNRLSAKLTSELTEYLDK